MHASKYEIIGVSCSTLQVWRDTDPTGKLSALSITWTKVIYSRRNYITLQQPLSLFTQRGMEIDFLHFLHYYTLDEKKNTRGSQAAHNYTRSNITFSNSVSCNEVLQQTKQAVACIPMLVRMSLSVA
jgi:hypothetical protein